MAKLLYTGKVKEMWSTDDPEVLRVVYTDQATAGNGEKKDDFKNKAYLNNEISTLIFEYLSKNGVPTHFIKKISDTEELVKKCDMLLEILQLAISQVVMAWAKVKNSIRQSKNFFIRVMNSTTQS